jgi:hypothetical protein
MSEQVKTDPASDDRLYERPPCAWCEREKPCECSDAECRCDCGRCMAPYVWELN